MYVKVRDVAFCGAVSEYLPSTPVMVPTVVPVTETDTPGTAPSPSTEEVTVPVMTLVCA
jgi:hypothetical protein